MDTPASPPKRMTRARAAAKAGEPPARTARTVTVASRAAKRTAAAATNKRKTRADDDDEPVRPARDHPETRTVAAASSSSGTHRAVRSRFRPAGADERDDLDNDRPPAPAVQQRVPVPAPPSGRGRPKKPAVDGPVPDVPKPRGRARKPRLDEQQPAVPAVEQPVRKAARGRAAMTAVAVAAPVPKPSIVSKQQDAGKKTVTFQEPFQEPEKENMVLAPAPVRAKKPALTSAPAKAASSAGATMSSRPARRLPAAAGSAPGATRTSARSGTAGAAPAPLSPGKVTQMPVRDVSEGELAGLEKAPVRSILKPANRRAAAVPVVPAIPQPVADAAAAVVERTRSPSSPRQDAQPFERFVGSPKQTWDDAAPAAPATPAGLHSSPRRPPTTLQSVPCTDQLKSPAKRHDGLHMPSLHAGAVPVPPSPTRSTPFLTTPARRTAIVAAFGGTMSVSGADTTGSTYRPSTLFDSSAKRLQFHVRRPYATPARIATASASAALELPISQSLTFSTPTPLASLRATDSPVTFDLAGMPLFPGGRISAVLPGSPDPVMDEVPVTPVTIQQLPEEDAQIAPDHEGASVDEIHDDAAPAAPTAAAVSSPVDEPEVTVREDDGDGHREEPADAIMLDSAAATATDQASDLTMMMPQQHIPIPLEQFGGNFGLRAKDCTPYQELDVDSDDELTSTEVVSRRIRTISFPVAVGTPTPTPAPAHSLGFTPLARQLSATWASDSRSDSPSAPLYAGSDGLEADYDGQYDHTMSDLYVDALVEAAVEADMAARYHSHGHLELGKIGEVADILDPGFHFGDVPLTDEDVELAAEAHEMSLLGPDDLGRVIGSSPQSPAPAGCDDDTLSEASQEYGDENQSPAPKAKAAAAAALVVDPSLLFPVGRPTPPPPVTPPPHPRVLVRTFHTVSKVPLKPADFSTPSPVKPRRAASASRLVGPAAASTPTPTPTPTPHDAWAAVGTPARTPRPDLSPTLLHGAVVFVDVRTSEGADASSLFVDLLAQMGARCLRSWPATVSDPKQDGPESGRAACLTHVVFKDGSKRTLEKVCDSAGLVQCVGVAWVLDCERENQWLSERPYSVDASAGPGRGRVPSRSRRRSMEPRALAHLNGMIVPSPVPDAPAALTAPSTPLNRRDSSLWVRTPPDAGAAPAPDHTQSWGFLTPVPPTPAPDTVARYAAALALPSSPADSDDPYAGPRDPATCPAKPRPQRPDPRARLFGRLLDARRRSTQFAPKVGSPLAKEV